MTELRALIALRDAARELLALEADADLPDAQVAPARVRAARLYRDYVERWGPLNRATLVELNDGRLDPQTGLPELRLQRPDLDGFRRDPDYHTVMALEVYDREHPDGRAGADPAPPGARPARTRDARGERARGVADLSGRGRHRSAAGRRPAGPGDGRRRDRGARRSDLPRSRARRAVGQPARVPDRRRPRAPGRRARPPLSTTAHYRRNVAALAEVEPVDLGPLDIAVSLGAPWISAEDIEAFVRDVLGGRVKVWHLPSAASWKIVPLGKAPVGGFGLYSTPRISAYDVLSAGLNGRAPVVFDSVSVPGRRLRVRNQEQSLAAQERLTALQERFRTWLWEDAARTARLTREYNRRFNTHVVATPRRLAADLPRPRRRHRVVAVAARHRRPDRVVARHVVRARRRRRQDPIDGVRRGDGAPPRPRQQTADRRPRTPRRAGRARGTSGLSVRPIPRPGRGRRTRSRELLAARCATGEWDAVIMSHGTFSALPVAPEVELEWLAERLDEIEAQVRGGRGGSHGRSVLQAPGRCGAGAHREGARRGSGRRSRSTTSASTCCLIDEAHYFKRLPVASRMQGISLGSSQRAADLLLKAQLLRAPARRAAEPRAVHRHPVVEHDRRDLRVAVLRAARRARRRRHRSLRRVGGRVRRVRDRRRGDARRVRRSG